MQSLRERKSHRQQNAHHSVFNAPQLSDSDRRPRPSSTRRISILSLCFIFQTLLNIYLGLVFYYSRSSLHAFKTTKSTFSQPAFSQGLRAPSTASSTRLLDFHITIYAYDRPKHLLKLLQDITREAKLADIELDVHVIDDNSYGCQFDPANRNIFQADSNIDPQLSPSEVLVQVPLPSSLACTASHRFSAVEQFIHANRWKLYVSKYRHSRRRLWHLVRHAHALLRPVNAHFYLFLPDDDRLSRNFFHNVKQHWLAISDPRKLTLLLHVEESRETVPVWTDFHPRSIGNNLTRIGWVESGNFVATSNFLQFFNWSFPYIPIKRWIDNPPISSGVGATMSSLIHDARFHMFRTHYSLVAHTGVTLSKMNAQFRTPNVPSLLSKRFVDGEDAYQELLFSAATTTASIASHWVREASLHSAVYSLAPQVDRLNVYLNGYDSIPTFLLAPYITVVRSDDPHALGDIGDIGKFFWCNNLTTEFHITADDDIIYPPDYVDRLLAFRRSMRPPVVVGVHGIRLKPDSLRPSNGAHGRGYYASREVWMATEDVKSPVSAHIIGTGTMLYKVSEIGPIVLADTFLKPNMADVWFGILAQKIRIPIVVMPHNAGWLVEVPGTFEDSIYKKSTKRRHSDRSQTQAVLSLPRWQLFAPNQRESA